MDKKVISKELLRMGFEEYVDTYIRGDDTIYLDNDCVQVNSYKIPYNTVYTNVHAQLNMNGMFLITKNNIINLSTAGDMANVYSVKLRQHLIESALRYSGEGFLIRSLDSGVMIDINPYDAMVIIDRDKTRAFNAHQLYCQSSATWFLNKEQTYRFTTDFDIINDLCFVYQLDDYVGVYQSKVCGDKWITNSKR